MAEECAEEHPARGHKRQKPDAPLPLAVAGAAQDIARPKGECGPKHQWQREQHAKGGSGEKTSKHGDSFLNRACDPYALCGDAGQSEAARPDGCSALCSSKIAVSEPVAKSKTRLFISRVPCY